MRGFRFLTISVAPRPVCCHKIFSVKSFLSQVDMLVLNFLLGLFLLSHKFSLVKILHICMYNTYLFLAFLSFFAIPKEVRSRTEFILLSFHLNIG